MLEELLLQDKIAAAEEIVDNIVQDTVFNYMEKVAAEYGYDLDDIFTDAPELFELMYKAAAEDVADYYADEATEEDLADAAGEDISEEDLALAEELLDDISELDPEDQVAVLEELGL